MRPDLLVPVREPTDVASARREALHEGSRVGLADEPAGRLALIVTEAVSNLIKHGNGGELILRDISTAGSPAMEIIALDSGKGMADVARCFTDGFTTAGSPGTGLGAIARLSSFYDIYSQPEKGTVLMAQVRTDPAAGAEAFEVGAISIPYPGETVCGDAWELDASPDRIRIVMADGLGHGIFASEAAAAAVLRIDDDRSVEPINVIEDAHSRLKSTRGAAIGVVDIQRSKLTFAGIGNIAGAVVSEGGLRRQMISMNGTLGHEMRVVRQFQYPLPEHALVILHSDGLGTHWSVDKYPGLMQKHPSIIAGVLFRDFRRLRDDASVLVLRPREWPR